MSDLVALVLAAGKGTRMKSKIPKALHPLGGKPLARHPIDICKRLVVERVLVVIGHGLEQVRAALGEDVEYVIQPELLGTGHAVLQAEAALSGFGGDVLILPGDAPLITQEILRDLIERHRDTGAAATVLTAEVDNPRSYGRILRGEGGGVAGIVETKDATPEQREIREVNSSVYCFKAPLLYDALSRVQPDNAQKEYYLTDAVALLVEGGLRVEAFVSPEPEVVEGVNNRVELAAMGAVLRQRKCQELMLSGVTVIDPGTAYIDSDVTVGPDTVIHPMTILEGDTAIGEDCEIGPYTRLIGVKVGNGTSVLASQARDSVIGGGVRIGPYAHLRPDCAVSDHAKIGDFVELKKAQVGERASIAHLAYMGDAVIGSHANIGAGAITCNYNGRAKHVTVIEDNAFIGSNAILVAPVRVGSGAYVAAGSVITEDVPADALGIARSRQTNKEEWARRRREER
ncbi:MAG: bifunctional UDP-N-acetylglucosamine diphosphorylase/glucosamine-1-phosphate N-acetyltransferase GlmU [Armatimonadetes bacterium]|nr:bifunctional UDP-N-acetylglucosamine diphosphorylase/glucosamine-1-phosphate N-acetyltransferase GlmU [Armatimonadota bacterium]